MFPSKNHQRKPPGADLRRPTGSCISGSPFSAASLRQQATGSALRCCWERGQNGGIEQPNS